MSKKLLVVDDHEIIRVGLRLMLESTDIEVAAEATTAAEAIAAVEKSVPDVVLMDIRMEGGDGLNALGAFEARSRGPPDRLVLGLRQSDLYRTGRRARCIRVCPQVGASRAASRGASDRNFRRIRVDSRGTASRDGCFGDSAV